MKVNSKPVDAASLTRKGYARIHRLWRTGDDVELTLPMPVQEIEANPRVRMDCGKVALQRGPLVYCLEEADNGPNLADLVLPRRAQFKLRYEKNLLGGVVTISGKASRRGVKPGDEFLYRPISSRSRTVNFKAVPYCLWANRRPGEMLVWLRKET
jgi:DUF1680 family protein